MKEVFQKRRHDFVNTCFKYLRYVFNDHFVLVLFILFGFLMVQYSQLLRHFPEQHVWIGLILILVIGALLSFGSIATYLEAPDKLFYLPKETEIVAWLTQARRRAFWLWVSVQTAVLLFLEPIFFKIGFSWLMFAGMLVVLAFCKWWVMKRKSSAFYAQGRFSWEQTIAYEERRRQRILRFFALFTTVKGITASVKRRSYLDGVLRVVPKKHAQTWLNLYTRAFLRSSDYLALTLRLTVLSFLALVFMPNRMVAVALALLFNYLLLFQLLGLAQHFDYQYLTQLYPLTKADKSSNLKTFLRSLSYVIAVPQLVLTLNWQAALVFLVVTVIVTEGYISYKIGKMID